MSPIHLAAAFTPFVNEGKLAKPVLIVQKEATAPVEIISPEVANTVKNALREVVSRQGGTAHSLHSIAGGLAGKTGTRERGSSALRGRENLPGADGELSYEEGRRRLGKRRKGVRDVISKRSNPEQENKAS